MCKITNNSDFTLSVDAQQAIRNAAANISVDSVEISEDSSTEDDNLLSVYETENEEGDSNFLFSVNLKTGQIE